MIKLTFKESKAFFQKFERAESNSRYLATVSDPKFVRRSHLVTWHGHKATLAVAGR